MNIEDQGPDVVPHEVMQAKAAIEQMMFESEQAFAMMEDPSPTLEDQQDPPPPPKAPPPVFQGTQKPRKPAYIQNEVYCDVCEMFVNPNDKQHTEGRLH